MKNQYPWRMAVASLVAALAVTAPAHAALVTANAEVFLSGSTADSASDSDGSSASASASAGSSSARASSSASGALLTTALAGDFGGVANVAVASFGAFSAPPPAGVQSAIAQSTWSNTIFNNTGTLVNYKWLFQVTNPRVGNSGHPDDYASLDIDIMLNNVMIWEGYAILDDCSLTTSNIALTQFGCFAGGPSFTIGLDLGNFVSGQSFTLDYVMTAFADTGDPTPIDGSPTQAGIGDPFDPDPTAFGRIVATTVVETIPTPLSLQLFCIGLAGLLFSRRKQRIAGPGL
tara:strand:+ start:81008 stop:81874 length:867 start_codon:yes stop_codon:yes gene_type:complete